MDMKVSRYYLLGLLLIIALLITVPVLGSCPAKANDDTKDPTDLEKLAGTWDLKNDKVHVQLILEPSEKGKFLTMKSKQISGDTDGPPLHGYFFQDVQTGLLHFMAVSDAGFYETAEEYKREGDDVYFKVAIYGSDKFTSGELILTIGGDSMTWKTRTGDAKWEEVQPVTLNKVQ